MTEDILTKAHEIKSRYNAAHREIEFLRTQIDFIKKANSHEIIVSHREWVPDEDAQNDEDWGGGFGKQKMREKIEAKKYSIDKNILINELKRTIMDKELEAGKIAQEFRDL